MHPKDLAKLDQTAKEVVETQVPMWRSLYLKCMEEGFSPQQSMELLKEFIRGLYGK
ncbi:MAG: hypothetical protein ACW97P_10500 [Candidatus Hodarchaeales archaeon]|jgi:hypothetical protein